MSNQPLESSPGRPRWAAKNAEEMASSALGGAAGKKQPWKRYGDIMQDSIEYLKRRASGQLKSLRTQWPTFNSIGLNGIEWQSLYVIAARPGVGKTLIAASLTRNLQTINHDQDFAVLHFQFEMLGRNMAVREFSAAANLNIRYMQSAQDDGLPPLKPEDLQKIVDYASHQHSRQEYIVDKAMNVKQMEDVIVSFQREVNKPVVITLDHTLLVRQNASETSKQQTLQNLATMMTEMKNRLHVTFIVLTQLNREIDDAERQRPGQLSNYPTEADVFGSDYLLQCADVMIAYNRPAKYNISLYGPHRYEINDKYLLAMHVIKNRFGEPSIQWYRAQYETMSVVEAPIPKMIPKK
jgi:replicative DNA helicase